MANYYTKLQTHNKLQFTYYNVLLLFFCLLHIHFLIVKKTPIYQKYTIS